MAALESSLALACRRGAAARTLQAAAAALRQGSLCCLPALLNSHAPCRLRCRVGRLASDGGARGVTAAASRLLQAQQRRESGAPLPRRPSPTGCTLHAARFLPRILLLSIDCGASCPPLWHTLTDGGRAGFRSGATAAAGQGGSLSAEEQEAANRTAAASEGVQRKEGDEAYQVGPALRGRDLGPD